MPLRQEITMRNLLGYAAAAGLAVAAMLGPTVVHHAAEAHMATTADQPGDCVAVVWTDVVAQYGEEGAQHVWDDFADSGWTGYAGDHMEALWSPDCTNEYLATLWSEPTA